MEIDPMPSVAGQKRPNEQYDGPLQKRPSTESLCVLSQESSHGIASVPNNQSFIQPPTTTVYPSMLSHAVYQCMQEECGQATDDFYAAQGTQPQHLQTTPPMEHLPAHGQLLKAPMEVNSSNSPRDDCNGGSASCSYRVFF